MAMYKILSTKSLPANLVTEASAKGITLDVQEFISVQPVAAEILKPQLEKYLERRLHNLIFTSANAVQAVRNAGFTIHGKTIFCLSGSTSVLLAGAGKLVTAANATALANKLVEKKIHEAVFFCGNIRRDEIPAIAKAGRIDLHEVIVYETVTTSAAMETAPDGVLFFSPSGVESFFSANKDTPGIVYFTIGETTAVALRNYTSNTVIVSPAPSAAMLVQSVIQYFEQLSPAIK